MKKHKHTGSKRRSEKYQKKHMARNTGASMSIHPQVFFTEGPHRRVKKIPYPAFTKYNAMNTIRAMIDMRIKKELK